MAEIIAARVEEIFEKIEEEFKKIERSGMLPGGVFLIGGGTRLSDIVEVGKNKLRLPVALGTNTMDSVIDKVNETEYLNALGLVIWGSKIIDQGRGFNFGIPGGNTINQVLGKIAKWFKSLLP